MLPSAPTDPAPELDPVSSSLYHRRAWLRGTLAALVCTSIITAFSAGSCHYHGCHHDDDNDDDDFCHDDDDDVGRATNEPQAPQSYRLEDFELVTASVAGAHPVARLERIVGISLTAWGGSGEYGAEEFTDFTAKVLEFNDDLIGLPSTAGRLEFAAVKFGAARTTVRYVQVAEDLEGFPRVLPTAGTEFVFDLIGNLVEIDNHTMVQ